MPHASVAPRRKCRLSQSDALSHRSNLTRPARRAELGLSRSWIEIRIMDELLSDRQIIHIRDFREVAAEFPESRGLSHGYRTMLGVPLMRDGVANRSDRIYPNGSSLRSRTKQSLSQNLCRPGGDRHRERAAVQRDPGAQCGTARGAGASDGNCRGARHHQPLADRRAAGARRHRRKRGSGLWD